MKTVLTLCLLACITLTGCVSASYSDKDGNKVSYTSLFKDIEANKVKAQKNDKGVTLEIGKVNSDTSEVINAAVNAVKTGMEVAK
jgi:hypothetical protein